MKHLAATLLLCLPMLYGFTQMIPNQSVEVLYDSRGNRIVRQIWTNSQNPGNKKDNADLLGINEMRLYPNPTKQELFISYPAPEQGDQITIIDITGKLVFMTNVADENPIITLFLEGLNAGTYIVQVQTHETTFRSKFIKQ